MKDVPPPLVQLITRITNHRVSGEDLTSVDLDLFADLKFSKREFLLLKKACAEILNFIFVDSFNPLKHSPPRCTIRDLIFYAQPIHLLRPPPYQTIHFSLEYLLIRQQSTGCLNSAIWIGFFCVLVFLCVRSF